MNHSFKKSPLSLPFMKNTGNCLFSQTNIDFPKRLGWDKIKLKIKNLKKKQRKKEKSISLLVVQMISSWMGDWCRPHGLMSDAKYVVWRCGWSVNWRWVSFWRVRRKRVGKQVDFILFYVVGDKHMAKALNAQSIDCYHLSIHTYIDTLINTYIQTRTSEIHKNTLTRVHTFTLSYIRTQFSQV